MAVRVIRKFRLLYDVLFSRTDLSPPQDGDLVTYDSGLDKLVLAPPTAATAVAPDDADYLVGTAHPSLTSEIVVGTTPGGELGGTWASPTVDSVHSGSSHASITAAAQAALNAHLSDASDAHDASAISILDSANDFTATDVEGALAELQTDHEADAQALADHLADTADAHDATAISFSPAGTIAATDVQAAIEEVAAEAGGGGAPTGADYLVGTAQGGLSAEIVVGTSPGGELGGTWASPTVDATHSGSSHADVQAAAEATAAAALNAHITDATDAHDASAISILDAANDFTATEVEGALAELQADHETDEAALAAHIADTSDAHDASAISADSTTLVGTGTDVQAVLEELDNGIADHLADSSGAHAASAISFTPDGSISATDVQAAIVEVRDEAGGGGSGTKAYPIQLLNPRTTSLSGNSFFTVLGLTDWDAGHWEFLLDVEGKVYGIVRVPPSYVSGGSIKLEIGANATTGVTRLVVATKAVADGESMNPTLTDETAQDITVPGTAYLRKTVTFSLTETLAASDLLIVEVFHDGDHANDTLAVNTLLFGAWLEVTA